MDVFQQASTQTTTTPSVDDALVTKLSAIVNENGEPKYKDVTTALDALKASQEFIPTLQASVANKDTEIAQLRAQLASTTSIEETLQRFAQQGSQPQPNAQPQETAVTTPPQQGPVDVESLVQNAFQAHLAQTQATGNYEQVQTALVQSYGTKAVEHLQNKAQELGTTVDALQDMARSNPTMAITLLGLNNKPNTGLSHGGINTAGFGNSQPEKLQRPTTSLLVGANTTDVHDFMAKIKAEVYREHGITA